MVEYLYAAVALAAVEGVFPHEGLADVAEIFEQGAVEGLLFLYSFTM